MNVMSSSYYSATRKDGVCSGTLWRQKEPASGSSSEFGASLNSLSIAVSSSTSPEARSCDYCILVGCRLECYESQLVWSRRDPPNVVFYVVGASASIKDTYEISFRLVSNQGTHLLCQATSKECRNVWLSAFQAGLELSLGDFISLSEPALLPPEPQAQIKRFVRSNRSYCVSCGAVDGGNPPVTSPVKTNSSSISSINLVGTKSIGLSVAPMTQYGCEGKVDLCDDCATAQGLLQHVEFYKLLLQAAQHEQRVLEKARDLCWKSVLASEPQMKSDASLSELQQDNSEEPMVEDDAKDNSASTESWSQVDRDTEGTPSPPDSWQSVEDSPNKQSWIHLPPNSASTVALLDVVREPTQFGRLATASPFLESLRKNLEDGVIGAPDFLEQLDERTKKRKESHESVAALKKQAFRVSGDLGCAMKLLLESALSAPSRRGSAQDDVLICILDFLLELCEEGEMSTVGFFWPQICQIHLRMLPAANTAEARRVELYEDFLLTVSSRYSVHLALDLVWSHTADLEESLGNPSCSTACRRRRHAVLRFVCELESVLFDFEDCWGGGSVSLRNMLSPTGHQVQLLQERMQQIQEMRMSPLLELCRSGRMDLLLRAQRELIPEEAALEKLRVAKNADYFSCHLNFTRRLSDIAEKLRHKDIAERASVLEDELALLNSSGTMGGDPLNRVRVDYIRVMRIPSTEGHVFRSKERTPVLLLMEVMDEGACYEEERRKERPNAVEHNAFDEGNTETEETEGEQDDHTGSKESEGDASESLYQYDRPVTEEGDESQSTSPLHTPKGTRNTALIEAGRRPRTPRKDVEDIVNSVAVQTLKDIVLPNIKANSTMEADVTATLNDLSLDDKVEYNSDNESDPAKSDTKDNSDDQTISTRKRIAARGLLDSKQGSFDDSHNSLAPTGDVRRDVLNAIMLRGMQGNSIAAGTAISIQRSLQELERRRATELLLRNENEGESSTDDRSISISRERSTTSQSLAKDDAQAPQLCEEDEVMESIRLLLIQNRVAQGKLSAIDAAKVLQHVSLNRVSSGNNLGDEESGNDGLDEDEVATIDAGDVDPRLVGCGPVPPAVLKALALWKGGMVNNAELLELVKKDAAFIRHSILLDSENEDKLAEDSAFWGRFAFGERWAEKKSRISSSSPEGTLPGWDLLGVIVKSNDDLRQEAFVMQLIELCQEAFDLAGLELWVSPYRILATGRTTGVIEMVRNAMSFDALKKRPGYGKGGLREHFRRMTEFTANPSEAFRSAQMNFVRSLAAYSLMSYLFLFKDRHNGNLLLDTAGHLIHIDFGFVFGIAPGGSFSLEMSTPFKLTEEMLDVMGGLRSSLFSEFVTLFCCGFLALQAYRDTFLTIVEITCEDSTFKCFEGKDTTDFLDKLRERFCPNKTKEETVAFALDLIKQATTSYGTRQYDLYQYMSQGIAA